MSKKCNSLVIGFLLFLRFILLPMNQQKNCPVGKKVVKILLKYKKSLGYLFTVFQKAEKAGC